MSIRSSLRLLLLAGALVIPTGYGATAQVAKPPDAAEMRAAKKARASYARCAGRELYSWQLTDEAWIPSPVDLTNHRKLRARYGLATPEGATMVALYSFGVHHSGEYWSTVAVRGADGWWTASDVVEQGGGLMGGSLKLAINRTRVLPAEAGTIIDRALADPCTYLEPTVFYGGNGFPGVGAPHNSLTIMTPRRSRTAAFFFAGHGQMKTIRAALFGL